MTLTSNEMWREFASNKMAVAGFAILAILISMSVIAFATIPAETFRQWNDPSSWLEFPKSAQPSWVNLFLPEKIPEHSILAPHEYIKKSGNASVITDVFVSDYEYDSFPSDFIYHYSARYQGSPLLQLSVMRPDGLSAVLYSSSLPPYQTREVFDGLAFSADNAVKTNILSSVKFGFDYDFLPSQDLVFSELGQERVLKGTYVFKVTVYDPSGDLSLDKSQFVLGGKVYGLLGTDELRRDLAVGVLWGTPLALFIGVTVSLGSVVIGMVYGVYAGFKGRATDEVMMRFNDIIYAMPALPLLIILAVTIGNSIFLIVGFLVIFGWVGIAKVSRSMAMQIKTLQYIEASKLMGQKDFRIILKHVLPQLLPYAFASIAISVPAAITTEAGLSFLGLGDTSFPTWGQILHDASSYGAAERGMWWWILPPGIMIAVTGLAFVFIGSAMDAVANPKLRR